MRAALRQHLIFDADDTLWENNVVFEQVIAEFIAWLDHPRLAPGEVRSVLDQVERLHAVEHGYGTKVFTLTLEVTAQRVREGELTAADRGAIARLITRLAWDQLDIIDGVPETLAELRGRHDLLLLTKGNHEEQAHKIARSGLAPLFRRTVITPEKTPETYRHLVAEESLDPARTWMIGNSPRSDILPAVEAGLHGVFVPHEHTWRLEHEELPEAHDRILQVPHFRALLDHF
jgi:putative hydrolase of the HAD superfamily